MPSDKPVRILYVDDDAASRTLLVELLMDRSVEIATVENVVQAFNVIEDEDFDLYLIDAGLPDIDGLDLCRALREIEPETPIIVYTGSPPRRLKKPNLYLPGARTSRPSMSAKREKALAPITVEVDQIPPKLPEYYLQSGRVLNARLVTRLPDVSHLAKR